MDGFAFKKEPLDNTYEIGEDIGSGHFAVVRRAIHRKSGEAFAAKFIRKRRGGGRKGAKTEDIQREVSILRQLDHENIIKLYDVFETNIEVILILELVTGGELFDYISEKDHLGEEEASAFIAQILRGLKHLHKNNIAHLDLKPENIMLRNRNTQSIKLIDFGLAQKIHGKEDIRALMGTAEFVAPEVVSYETLSLATDMWSVGVITYILLSGASPFLGDCQQETYHNITAINYQFDDEYFANTSELAKDFIEKLFVKTSRKRATVDDCLNHAWIRPKEPLELIKRQSAVINIDNFKAFMARKRWKQSMRVVSLCNRLSKSILLRKSNDTLGSRNTLDEDKRKALASVVEPASSSQEAASSTATATEHATVKPTSLDSDSPLPATTVSCTPTTSGACSVADDTKPNLNEPQTTSCDLTQATVEPKLDSGSTLMASSSDPTSDPEELKPSSDEPKPGSMDLEPCPGGHSTVPRSELNCSTPNAISRDLEPNLNDLNQEASEQNSSARDLRVKLSDSKQVSSCPKPTSNTECGGGNILPNDPALLSSSCNDEVSFSNCDASLPEGNNGRNQVQESPQVSAQSQSQYGVGHSATSFLALKLRPIVTDSTKHNDNDKSYVSNTQNLCSNYTVISSNQPCDTINGSSVPTELPEKLDLKEDVSCGPGRAVDDNVIVSKSGPASLDLQAPDLKGESQRESDPQSPTTNFEGNAAPAEDPIANQRPSGSMYSTLCHRGQPIDALGANKTVSVTKNNGLINALASNLSPTITS